MLTDDDDTIIPAARSAKSLHGDSFKEESPARTTLDWSRADGDLDTIRGPDPPHSTPSWLSSIWTPLHGALVFIVFFSWMCMRRIIAALRGARGGASESILSQLSSFDYKNTSPMSNNRTRDLASLPFEDSTRRRGVKAGLGTKGEGSKVDTSGDIEMQSLTASLASMHIPKMIYLTSAHEPASASSALASSCVLTPQRLQLLLPYLPASSQIQDLELKYSLSVCGASINDLYRRCGKMQETITVLQDSAGYVFGCYSSSPWRIHPSYYGNGSSFVFTLHPTFAVYPASGANTFFQLATSSSIAIGGGDHFSLWLDDSFRKGQSKPCQTFNSPSLSSEEDFRCHELEAWSFVDSTSGDDW